MKYFKGSRKNNYLNGLIILTRYDTIDENKNEVSKLRRFDYSFLKDKAWDNEIVGYLSQIHELKGKQVLYLRQKPADATKLVEIAKIQSTESSNEIEGIRTTDTRLRQLMSEKTTPRTRDEKEIAGYRDALNTVHENFEYIPLTPNYILQLHKIMFRRAYGLKCIRVDTHRKNKPMQNLLRESGFRYRGNILVDAEPGHDPHRQAFEKILKEKK